MRRARQFPALTEEQLKEKNQNIGANVRARRKTGRWIPMSIRRPNDRLRYTWVTPELNHKLVEKAKLQKKTVPALIEATLTASMNQHEPETTVPSVEVSTTKEIR